VYLDVEPDGSVLRKARKTLVPTAFAVVTTRQSTLGPHGGLWPILIERCAPAVETLIG
jgi:hypothetical protein